MNPSISAALPADLPLQETLSHIEARVRQSPNAAEHRWALIELLCVLGQWERALKQLQAWVKLDPAQQAQAQMLRGLIRAEHQRVEVFGGHLLPAPVVDRPAWMEHLAQAIKHNALGEHAEADALRATALEQAPSPKGQAQLSSQPLSANDGADDQVHTQTFDWISDSDSRLGPVCEVMMAGAYRWLAFHDIHNLSTRAPRQVLDLVWRPATITLRHLNQKPLHVYLPTRYSGTEDIAAEAGSTQRDALMLSKLTVWQDVGETGVFALGQVNWMCNGGDLPALDVRRLECEPQS